VKVYTSKDFDRQAGALVEDAKASKPGALARAKRLQDEFNFLRNLTAIPTEETATLKRVRQSGRFPVWRVSHPYDSVGSRADATIEQWLSERNRK